MMFPLFKRFFHACPASLKPFARTAYFAHSVRKAWVLHTGRQFETTLRLPGFPGSFKIRTGTSDALFVRMLANGYDFHEYRIPVECNPRVILDLGANIGAASILLARQFPNARVFAFEPMPDNAKILQHNVAAYGNITAVPFGLGNRSEERPYYRSCVPTANTGGFYNDGSLSWSTHGPHAEVIGLPVLSVVDAFERYGITGVDIIKIDCEGSEYEILADIPASILDGVSVIVGEFHGTRNEETRELLERRFDVIWTQTHERSADPRGGIGVFQAVRKGLTKSVPTLSRARFAASSPRPAGASAA